ncbi:hypothetical protein I551_0819 [Mycobacterium ulcerans str. Harvey]|uniref:Uncharacterized protein n=2 Tax=Mycobacterium ulcerans TaxID=1809 RepID=A0PLI7_MYCUA|nr:hypothetical protein MUL_0504 [Mycobacterium ulcerans Agy99]EUA92615.1 hypothetical protein I551_0819 [Mycobacterium ulcerans str. Harvey]
MRAARRLGESDLTLQHSDVLTHRGRCAPQRGGSTTDRSLRDDGTQDAQAMRIDHAQRLYGTANH